MYRGTSNQQKIKIKKNHKKIPYLNYGTQKTKVSFFPKKIQLKLTTVCLLLHNPMELVAFNLC